MLNPQSIILCVPIYSVDCTALEKAMLRVLYNDNDQKNSIDLIEVLTKRQPVQVSSTDNLFGVTSRPPGGRYNNIIKERSDQSVPITISYIQ